MNNTLNWTRDWIKYTLRKDRKFTEVATLKFKTFSFDAVGTINDQQLYFKSNSFWRHQSTQILK